MSDFIKLIAISLIMASCSTISKSKSITRSLIDSISVTKVDSNVTRSSAGVSVKKDNSITTKETEENYTKETVIEFDSSYGQLKDFLSHLGPGLTQEFIDSMKDAGQPLRTGWTSAADYFPDYINQVKKITIRERGVKKEKTNTSLNKVDSSANTKKEAVDLTKNVNTEFHKKETVKNKEVDRKSYWGWLWLLLIPAVWFAGYWLGFWPLIPKRKKKDDYAIRYTKYQPPKPPTTKI